MQHCLRFRLMVDVDVQGISQITVICGAGPRRHGRWDTQVDVFRRTKL